jgi:hypothetical protein
VTITASEEEAEDAPASRGVRNPALQLPTELIYAIVAIAIGEYIGDLILLPCKIIRWDPILILLHVSRTFRGCTIKLLRHLWGGTFVRERTRYASPSFPLPPLFSSLESLRVVSNPR